MASASDNIPRSKRVTKEQLEKWLNKKDVPGDFQQVEATWTSSKHWTGYRCAEVGGVLVKHLAICKICRYVLSVPEVTVQTLIRHQQSHAHSATPTGTSQGALTGYFRKTIVSPAIRDSTSKACLFMIAKDLQPFTIVDDIGFRSLAQHFINLGARYGKLDVSDILYDCTTLAKNHLTKEYDEAVANTRKELNKVPYVSVTTDHWIDDMVKNAYQAFTIHYITHDFRLMSKCIGLYELNFKSPRMELFL